MLTVNPRSSFVWSSPLMIHGVPMRGVPEKQGWAFTARGWAAVRAGGHEVQLHRRPSSRAVLHDARQDYNQRTVRALPHYFIVEPTGFCNKACPFCSIHAIRRIDEHGQPGNTMMRWADFCKLMNEIAMSDDDVYGLSLYQLGEPLLWKEHGATICDMVNYARYCGIDVVNVSTNGDVPNLPLLTECEVSDVIVSIDGTTEAVYLENRPSTKADDPGAFDRTVRRVEEFVRLKSERQLAGERQPYVRLQIINKANTRDQIVDFVERWIAVPGVDEVFVKQLDAMAPWVGDAAVPARESRLKMAAVREMPCQHLWAVGSMTASGSFNACCHDARSELTEQLPDGRWPNIRTMTFAEWWAGPFMTQLRADHHAGQFRMPCASCHERDPWLG